MNSPRMSVFPRLGHVRIFASCGRGADLPDLRVMNKALRDLDTGLFFSHGDWTIDPSLAQIFPDQKSIERLVEHYDIHNPEMVFLAGNRLVGGTFIGRAPNQN